MELIPLFVTQLSVSIIQNESCTMKQTDKQIINPQAYSLMERPNPISIVTSIVKSAAASKFVRELLMLNNEDQLTKRDNEKSTIMVANKLQVGYSTIAEPYNWLYLQLNSECNSKLLLMLASVTCTLIYESQSFETDRIYLQQVSRNFKSITGRFPNIYYLISQTASSNLTNSFQLPVIQIQLPHKKNIENHQLTNIQPLTHYNRKILNENFVLQSRKGKAISGCILLHYFQNCCTQCSKNEVAKAQNIWVLSLASMEQQLKTKSLQIYKSRMAKIYEDKKFVPLKLMYSSHQIARQIAIQSLQKYKYENHNLVNQLNDLILLQLQSILQVLTEINFKWSKSFIETQFAQIETRLKNKDIKQINSFKHQLSTFIDYFHKKIQLISCKKIQQYFQHFIVGKTMDCCSLIYEGEKKVILKQLNEAKQKLCHLENDSKEFRRQKIKQSSQNLNTMEQLYQKINYSKSRQEFLQSALGQLKNERQTMDIAYDNRIHEMQQKFLEDLKQVQQAKSGAIEQSADLKRKIMLLEAEIQKERQMHKQSHQQYKLMINEFKIKELLLHDELSQITIKSSQQLQLGRRELERSLNKSSINKTQKQRETLRLAEELQQIKDKYLQLEKQYRNLQYQMDLKDSSKQQQKRQLEVASKISEQKIYELQNKLQRFQKLEEHLFEAQKTMQDIMNERKQIHKQVAVLKQQNKFISQQFRQSQFKLGKQRIENLQLKNNIQELNDKIIKLDKVKVNEWTQTQFDNKLKKQLQEALKMTITLQTQYRKVKLQNNKLKYRVT